MQKDIRACLCKISRPLRKYTAKDHVTWKPVLQGEQSVLNTYLIKIKMEL